MSLAYILKRLGYAAVTLWAIVTLTFIMFRMLPGDPAAMMIDPLTDPARRDILLERYGLDEPLIVQYVTYLQGIVVGDLGLTFATRQPVVEVLNTSFMNSMVLTLAIFVIAFSVASIVGTLMGWFAGAMLERWGVNVSLILRGAPPYFVAALLIMIFAINLGWLPAGGMRSTGFGSEGWFATYFNVDFLVHLILPAVTGALYAGVTPMLIMRGTVLTNLSADYLDLARAKGLRTSRIIYRHSFRNAMLPLVAEASQFFAYAIGGLVVIEVVFSWPGLGREIVAALQGRDYFLAQGAFLYIGSLVVVTYLLSDIAIAILDPRARRVARTAT